VITEVFANFAGVDAGQQWFEVFNASGRTVVLDGVELVHSRPDGSEAHAHHVAGLAVAAGDYATLGDAPPDQRAAYVDYGYGGDLGDFYNTGGGLLTVRCDDTVVDTASYVAGEAGHARELGAAWLDATANDDLGHWCEANTTEFVAGNFGTPGRASDCTPLAQNECLDAGVPRAVIAPRVGELVITEVMASPDRVPDALGEWFEIVARAEVDLNGLGLDRATDSAPPQLIAVPSCVHLATGQYAVLARSKTGNGGLPPVVATFSFALLGTAGDVRIVAGATVIDAVSWPHASAGAALQLDPSATDATANDDPSHFCLATTPYGQGDLGTPGAPNLPCR
jgi:hypothetical protein